MTLTKVTKSILIVPKQRSSPRKTENQISYSQMIMATCYTLRLQVEKSSMEKRWILIKLKKHETELWDYDELISSWDLRKIITKQHLMKHSLKNLILNRSIHFKHQLWSKRWLATILSMALTNENSKQQTNEISFLLMLAEKEKLKDFYLKEVRT